MCEHWTPDYVYKTHNTPFWALSHLTDFSHNCALCYLFPSASCKRLKVWSLLNLCSEFKFRICLQSTDCSWPALERSFRFVLKPVFMFFTYLCLRSHPNHQTGGALFHRYRLQRWHETDVTINHNYSPTSQLRYTREVIIISKFHW